MKKLMNNETKSKEFIIEVTDNESKEPIVVS